MNVFELKNLTATAINGAYNKVFELEDDLALSDFSVLYDYDEETLSIAPTVYTAQEDVTYVELLSDLEEYLTDDLTVDCKKFLGDLLPEIYANKIWLGDMKVEEYDWNEETV